jgi:hypothetical protein
MDTRYAMSSRNDSDIVAEDTRPSRRYSRREEDWGWSPAVPPSGAFSWGWAAPPSWQGQSRGRYVEEPMFFQNRRRSVEPYWQWR